MHLVLYLLFVISINTDLLCVQGGGKIQLSLEDDVDTSLAWAFVLGDANRLVGPNNPLFKTKCMEISGKAGTEKLDKIRQYLGQKYSKNELIIKLLKTNPEKVWTSFCEPILEGKNKGWKEYNDKYKDLADVRSKIMNVYLEASRPGTSLTMPKLICLTRLYKEQTINLHTDINDAKMWVRNYFTIFDDIMGTIESNGYKGEKTCKFEGIPISELQPPQSLYLALLAAIHNLTTKKQKV